MLDALNFAKLARYYRDERAAILEKIETLCWSDEKGLYREGPAFEEYTQHAQVWAVLNGLVKEEKAKDVMTKTLTDKTLIPCSFAWQFYLFRALECAGMYEETESL